MTKMLSDVRSCRLPD